MMRLEMHGEEGAAMLTIFEAIIGGGTFHATGPDLLAPISSQRFSATLESVSGARSASAHGDTLGAVIVQLASEWRRQ